MTSTVLQEARNPRAQQKQDEEGEEAAEAPAEHAPGPVGGGRVAHRRHQAEAHAGQGHLQQTQHAHGLSHRPEVHALQHATGSPGELTSSRNQSVAAVASSTVKGQEN